MLQPSFFSATLIEYRSFLCHESRSRPYDSLEQIIQSKWRQNFDIACRIASGGYRCGALARMGRAHPRLHFG